jgi:oxygen-dependent protoporphyrinogen oxidase
LTVPKSSVSAKNRYVFYPDSLTLLPSSLFSAFKALITTRLLRSTVFGTLSEPFRPRSPAHLAIDGGDESVDAFFTRRFGKPLAENMISAMIHGIYSGDTRRLSMRAIFPGVWEAEREWGSVILSGLLGGFWRKRGWLVESEYQKLVKNDEEKMDIIKRRLGESESGKELIERMANASVWGLRGGLAVLTDKLHAWCEKEGVEFRIGDEGSIERLSLVKGKWEVRFDFYHRSNDS